MPSNVTIWIIGSESETRGRIATLVRANDVDTNEFTSIDEYLRVPNGNARGCVVLLANDLPGAAVDPLAQLQQSGVSSPVILLDGEGTTASVVRAMRQGAFSVLDHSANEVEIRDQIGEALRFD